ncbi:MAG: cyclase family protein [Fulvivirga sp.]|nr:cyclase family protein [Fulvivirga sp.]
MTITFFHQGKTYTVDLSKPISISIPIQAGKGNNPNCYWAEPVAFETIRSGEFIGSVAEGGSVNYQKITLTPHGNGTHTECYGHIVADKTAMINKKIKAEICVCVLISLEPESKGEDLVVTPQQLKDKWPQFPVDAVIIRTLPNDRSKLTLQYSGTNPPYLDAGVTRFLNTQNVKHLVVDLPSVDREIDGGRLAAHKAFWGVPDDIREDATITELAYINNDISDGIYLLNLQTIDLSADACPSRPVIYKIDGF